MLSEIVKLFPNINNFRRSDFFFVLYTKFIALLVSVVCVVLITDQFFRTSIDCHIGNDDKVHSKPSLDNYCWAHGTFTCSNKKYGQNGCTSDMEKVEQNYYPWLVFGLFIQSFFAYLPSIIWKLCERGFFGQLSHGLGRNKIELII